MSTEDLAHGNWVSTEGLTHKGDAAHLVLGLLQILLQGGHLVGLLRHLILLLRVTATQEAPLAAAPLLQQQHHQQQQDDCSSINISSSSSSSSINNSIYHSLQRCIVHVSFDNATFST